MFIVYSQVPILDCNINNTIVNRFSIVTLCYLMDNNPFWTMILRLGIHIPLNKSQATHTHTLVEIKYNNDKIAVIVAPPYCQPIGNLWNIPIHKYESKFNRTKSVSIAHIYCQPTLTHIHIYCLVHQELVSNRKLWQLTMIHFVVNIVWNNWPIDLPMDVHLCAGCWVYLFYDWTYEWCDAMVCLICGNRNAEYILPAGLGSYTHPRYWPTRECEVMDIQLWIFIYWYLFIIKSHIFELF